MPDHKPFTWAEIAHHLGGTFVVVVRHTGQATLRRRCFFTVSAAQAAAEKARARGHDVEVVLAELRPLFPVREGEQ